MPDEEKIDFTLFLNEYLNDARDGFQRGNDALLALEKDRSRTDKLDDIGRVFHTLKSSSSMLGFDNIANLAHSAEDLLGRMKKGETPVTQETIDLLFEIIDALERMVKERGERKSLDFVGAYGNTPLQIVELKKKIGEMGSIPENKGTVPNLPPLNLPLAKGGTKGGVTVPFIEKIDTIRVKMVLLDVLFNQVGELIITKNRLDTLLHGTESKELKEILAVMERTINAMQENVSASRMVPVDEIFQKFPRMVRDLAREQDKEIDLVVEGREIELDKSVLDAISEPLIHLLRNAVGHGIEPAGEREAMGKGKSGVIRLLARRAENHILVNVEDDGCGIDLERMKEVAVRKGFVKPEDEGSLSDKDVMNMLFSPGFSSVEDVTGLSGRGIGLNVVRTAAREMGGTVEVATEKGKGTRFFLTLPLTTAIVQTLMVEVSDHVFAIPSDIVLETMRVGVREIKEIADRKVFVRGEEVIPFIALNDVLGIVHKKSDEFKVVVIHRGDRLIGLGVDGVVGQMENIVKPLDPIAQKFRGFSGGTIMGDGRVALLLDIPALFGFEAIREERYQI